MCFSLIITSGNHTLLEIILRLKVTTLKHILSPSKITFNMIHTVCSCQNLRLLIISLPNNITQQSEPHITDYFISCSAFYFPQKYLSTSLFSCKYLLKFLPFSLFPKWFSRLLNPKPDIILRLPSWYYRRGLLFMRAKWLQNHSHVVSLCLDLYFIINGLEIKGTFN